MRLTDEPAFVAIPNFLHFDKSKIQYLDTLIYTALKSFDNPEKGCFAMQQTIATKAGMSKRFVVDSIKRLEAAKLIKVERSDKKKVPNKYFFPRLEHFEQIPVDFFEIRDLTPNEKAMLICLRQFFIHGPCKCNDELSHFVKQLGLSYNTVKPLYNGLIAQGYIAESFKVYRNSDGCFTTKRLTDKISWLKMSCITKTLAKFAKSEPLKLKLG